MPSLTPVQLFQLRDALSKSFDRTDISQLTLLSLNLDFEANIAPGALKDQIFEVIKWSERRGTTIKLLVTAEELRPDNQDLLAVTNQVKSALIAETSAAFAPAQKVADFEYQLQRVTRPELPFADVAVWRERMEKTERTVCRVELTQGTGEGTGFLVAKDLAITCYHVVETLAGADAEKIGGVVLRFDLKQNPQLAPIRDREYRLMPEWLAASSPYKELDYALLRVAGNPGDEEMGNTNEPKPRGWLKLSSAVPLKGHPLQILQHPRTLPMKLAFGTLVAQAPAGFLDYNVNTDGGSSGSPVCNSDWKPVALHRYGGPINNRGISCAAILRDLETKHLSGLLA